MDTESKWVISTILGTFIVIGLCVYSAVHTKFKEGDCAIIKTYEKWETKYIIKIKEVGNYSYLYYYVTNFANDEAYTVQDNIYSFDDSHKKTECP